MARAYRPYLDASEINLILKLCSDAVADPDFPERHIASALFRKLKKFEFSIDNNLVAPQYITQGKGDDDKQKRIAFLAAQIDSGNATEKETAEYFELIGV